MNWVLIYLVYGLIVIYVCLIPCIPIYFLVRKTKFEHPLLPICVAFVFNVVVIRLVAGEFVFSQIVPAIISIFLGLVFWRLYSGKWWLRVVST